MMDPCIPQAEKPLGSEALRGAVGQDEARSRRVGLTGESHEDQARIDALFRDN